MSASSPATSNPASIESPASKGYAPQRGVEGRATEAGLVVVKWSKWGKRRLYVNTANEQRVGWLDLDTGERLLDKVELASAFEAALQEAAMRDTTVDYSPQRTYPEPVADLSERRPGEHLQAQIAATIEAGRGLQPAHPGFEGKRAYSSWELGVLGELMVAEELDRLVDLDQRWVFLNSIQVGTHGSDIDHLVVGPGGVFTINAKHHHGGDVWVAGDAFRLNHVWKHYIRDSRHEAERASALLGTAAGVVVAAKGLVVLTGVAKFRVKAQPDDVRVLDQSELVDFLMSRPPILDEDVAALVLSSARRGCTWR